jgi:hypothetical protein
LRPLAKRGYLAFLSQVRGASALPANGRRCVRDAPFGSTNESRGCGNSAAGSMSALLGSRRFRPRLRFVVFDVPVLIGADLRGLPWQEGRGRRELLARALDCRLSSVHWSSGLSLVEHMEDGRLERIVLTDRTSTYRDGARVGGRRSWTAAGTSAKPGGATAASTNERPEASAAGGVRWASASAARGVRWASASPARAGFHGWRDACLRDGRRTGQGSPATGAR